MIINENRGISLTVLRNHGCCYLSYNIYNIKEIEILMITINVTQLGDDVWL